MVEIKNINGKEWFKMKEETKNAGNITVYVPNVTTEIKNDLFVIVSNKDVILCNSATFSEALSECFLMETWDCYRGDYLTSPQGQELMLVKRGIKEFDVLPWEFLE